MKNKIVDTGSKFNSFTLILSSIWYQASCISLYACAVCFGEGNSDLARGFYWGILLLLLLPFILIGAIGTKIWKASRKGTSQENSTSAV